MIDVVIFDEVSHNHSPKVVVHQLDREDQLLVLRCVVDLVLGCDPCPSYGKLISEEDLEIWQFAACEESVRLGVR